MSCGIMRRVLGARSFASFLKIAPVPFLLLILWPRFGHTGPLSFNDTASAFVERCRADCSRHADLVTCGTYRVVRWLHDVKDKEFSYGPIRLARISSMPVQTILPEVPRSRVFRNDIVDGMNFVRDVAEDFLTKRALIYTIDNSMSARSFGSAPIIVDEDELTSIQARKEGDGDWRIFKKKKSMILPVLILLNLVKLKLLLLPIFLGVHFIKKLLVLGSLLAPSILSHLKICKVAPHHQQPYPYHAWATAAEAPVDYPTGYGQEEAWAHRNDLQANLPYMGYHGYRNPYG